MTTLVKIPLDAIKSTRTLPSGKTRLRDIDEEGVATIAESMKIYGQLQPIVIEEDGELLDGAHRVAAARVLNWPDLEAITRDSLADDQLLARTIELEANIRRVEMTWQQRTVALAELHKLRTSQDPNWSQDVTGQIAGVPQARVAEALTITKMMEMFPEIAEAKSVNQALSWARAKAASIMRVKDVKDSPEDFSELEQRLVLGDSVDVIKTVPDGSFHLVLTDPPFGINYDRRVEGQEHSMSAYQDDEENYLRLLGMAPDLYRVIRPNGWLIWFLGISWYERAKAVFRGVGFTVDEIPIVWDRSEGRTFTTRPDRYFSRAYDIALHCVKGDPQMVQRNKPNIISVAPVDSKDRDLLVERPVELYEELIRRLTVEGEIVADFFTGSGSCLAAAAMTKRKFWGCEISAERRAVALQKIRAYMPDE